MMPIPCKMNPFGKSNKPTAFELVVKPGILASTMSFWFIPRWNSGGYCSVDWGDGQKEDATISVARLTHTYAKAGTYTVKIKAECYQVGFSDVYSSIPIIAYCSGNWDALGYLTGADCMFRNCVNMKLNCTSLPEGLTTQLAMFGGCSNATFSFTKFPDRLITGRNMFVNCSNATFSFTKLPDRLTNGDGMFNGCTNAQLPLTSLPEGLEDGWYMFNGCSNAEINLDTLVANAPAKGWTKLTRIGYMFNGCSKVTGSRSAFLAKCPSNVTGADTAFGGTNTTE